MKSLLKTLALTIPVTLLSGCFSLGPSKLTIDRVSYAKNSAESWKEQMLLNIVKLRYGDVPMFVDVQSMISNYTFSGNVGAQGTVHLDPGALLSGGAAYLDNPTVIYGPLTGSKFATNMLTPILPGFVSSMVRAGKPAKPTLQLTVKSINGLKNQNPFKNIPPESSKPFFRLLDVIAQLQQEDLLMLEANPDDQTNKTSLLRLLPSDDLRLKEVTAEFRSILNLDPSVNDYMLVMGNSPGNRREIAIQTRSMLDLLAGLSAFIELPGQDATSSRVIPVKAASAVVVPLLRIQSDKKPRKTDCFTSVEYLDHQFWIANDDIMSKTTFSTLMYLFSLIESGQKTEDPQVVIPTSQ